MARIKDRREARQRRHQRLRQRVIGTSARPRLSVFRSLGHTYAQVIDDSNGHTIVSASTRELSPGVSPKTVAALEIGKLVAERAKVQGIKQVVFDRGGNKYHGRVKALADGAREGGLDY